MGHNHGRYAALVFQLPQRETCAWLPLNDSARDQVSQEIHRLQQLLEWLKKAEVELDQIISLEKCAPSLRGVLPRWLSPAPLIIRYA